MNDELTKSATARMEDIKPLPLNFFSWGSRCAAVLWVPLGEKPKSGWPGVVMCHGFRGIKEWLLPPIAQEFTRRGLAVLTFDYRGFGESDGVRGRLAPHDQMEDVRNALTFMGGRLEVDEDRLGLWGTSFGCGIAIEAAAKDPRAKVIVAQVGPANIPRLLNLRPPEGLSQLQQMLHEDARTRVLTGKGGEIDPAGLMKSDEPGGPYPAAEKRWPRIRVTFPLDAVNRIAEYTPEKYVELIAPRPLLLIGAKQDQTVPVTDMERYYNLAREPKRLEIFDTTHYGIYEGPQADKAIALAGKWLCQHL